FHMIPLPPSSTLFPYTTLFRSRRQPVFLIGVEQIGSGRHEHEHWPRDPRRPQLGALLERRDAVPPWLDRLQGLGDGDGSHPVGRSEEHTSELQSRSDLVCRLLL